MARRRQHDARHSRRDIEPERPGRTVAKGVAHVERGVDLGESGGEAFDQADARFRRRHAARGAV